MKSFNKYRHVFEPLTVGTTTLKNRIIFSPMVSDYTNSLGEPTQGYVDFVEEQARTGVALINLGATPINWETAPDYPAELDITSDNKINGLVLLAEAAHRHGAKLSVELVHAGRGVHPDLIQGGWGLAPSNFPIPGQYPYLKEMDQHDIEHTIDCYVQCAVRLKKAQFDGALIHAAHGNLLAAFLSPLTNHRNDYYGGSFENRCRFPLMILKAVREAVGDDFILDMRISGDEMVEGGMQVEEVTEFIKEAQQYLDMVNISAGLIVDWRAQFFTMPPYYQPHCLNKELSKAVKNCTDITIPVTVVGCITSVDEAEQLIEDGCADGCYMARALLADTEMLKKSYRGKSEDVRPCLRCYSCADGGGNHISCAVNPQLGRGYRFWEIRPALKSKKVMVIGGGPAGMTAAQTAARRGHSVTLYEKSEELGGTLNDIDKLPFKNDLLRYTEWLVSSTLSSDVTVKTGVEVTKEVVEKEDPDAIIVAIGAQAVHPGITGMDRPEVLDVRDVEAGRVTLSGKVVVCGGGASGCECALGLAMAGCDVTIVDRVPADDFAHGMTHITRGMLLALLDSNNIEQIGCVDIRKVDDEGVHIEDNKWQESVLKADYVVNALGLKALCTEEFTQIMPDVFEVGDCAQIGTIYTANKTAFDCAMEI